MNGLQELLVPKIVPGAIWLNNLICVRAYGMLT